MPNALDLDTRFSQQPQANIPRSVIPRKSDLKTTMKFGKLYPIYCDEILPADSKKMSLGSLVRMATPLFPVMDSSYLDFYAFFVPNRLVWNHWQEFMGENKDSAWVSDVQYSVPTLDYIGIPNDTFEPDSIFDHFGLPTNVEIFEGMHFNALPLRSYNLIWNEWFRDQNYQNPIQLNIGDDDSNNRYALLDVNKLHDEFTSVLPEPQKGESVSLLFNGGLAPVVSVSSTGFTGDGSFYENYAENWSKVNGVPFDEDGAYGYLRTYAPSSSASSGVYDVLLNTAGLTEGTSVIGRSSSSKTGAVPMSNGIQFTNLVASLNEATISTVNQLRNAIVVQQYLEKLALGGSRYTEIIRSLFGVLSPDARLQRPELLGHIRLNIEMQQVVQTSFTGGDHLDATPLGNTGAYSKTTGYEFLFDKSFVEHGHLLILACARTEQSYQQGLDRMWSRKAVTDFYNPVFANIGNQPILNERIYFSSNQAQNKEVFGYQEAWSEYRYKPNRVSGAFRSNHPLSLDAWHYSQYFQTLPKAGADFLKQDSDVVDRTLAVQEDTQLLCNFFFDEVATRPMPVYSIPGLDVL